MDSKTIVDKCNVCKYWAICELQELESTILKSCTNCGNKH